MMRVKVARTLLLGVCCFGPAGLAQEAAVPVGGGPPVTHPEREGTLLRGMLSAGGGPATTFVANGGQWPSEVRFGGRGSRHNVWVGDDWVLVVPAAGRAADAMRLSLPGEPPATAQGEELLPGEFNFFLGNDPLRWATGVSGFGRVRLSGVQDGLEVDVRGTTAGLSLRLHLIATAGSAPVALDVSGARALSAQPDGSMTIETSTGSRWTLTGRARGKQSGGSRPIAVRVLSEMTSRILVDVEDRSVAEDVEVELDLNWATHLGGAHQEQVSGVGFAPGGDVIVVGNTNSADFPITPGAFDDVLAPPLPLSSKAGAHEIFVTRLSQDGTSLVYSTFLGGEKGESANAVHVTAEGSVIIAGETSSPDFPSTPGALALHGTKIPVFVIRLASGGDELVYSAKLGGFDNGINLPEALAIDGDGNVLVGGYASTTTFPVTPDAMQSEKKQSSDGFLFRLSSDGSTLLYSTYLGSDTVDSVHGLAVSPTGDVILGGRIRDQIVTPGAFDTVDNSIFLARLSPDLKTIKASTYFGGVSSERLFALRVGLDDRIYIAGETASYNLPVTPGALKTTSACGICGDGFVACFDPMLTSLVYSTYVAGALATVAWDLHVDSGGVATVAGSCNGPLFPVTAGAFDTTWNGKDDLFVLRLSPDGSTAWYGTYYGGSQHEGLMLAWPVRLAVDAMGAVVLASTTNSPDFPATAGGYQPVMDGTNDGVVVRLELLPEGVARFGTSTPGSHGPLALGVTAMPQVGSADFALTCTGAPPFSTRGWLAVSLNSLSQPVAMAGVSAWVDPSRLVSLLPVTSGETGLSVAPLRLPASPSSAGLSASVQFFWQDPGGPSGWSASNALRLVLQP